MSTSRRTWAARALLLLYVGICSCWLIRLDFRRHVSVDVLDLIPSAEQAPEANILRNLASDTEAKVMLFSVRMADTTRSLAAAHEFAAALAASPEFAEAVSLGDPVSNDLLGKTIFDQRFALLLPTWLAEQEENFSHSGQLPEKYSVWVANHAVENLQAFLARPEAVALQEVVARDPLLLVTNLIRNSQGLAPSALAGKNGDALVWARIRASPLSEEGQKPVFAAIEKAKAKVSQVYRDVQLKWTGVNLFAADSRARIEHEFSILNIISVIAVLGVAAVFVRQIWRIAHLVPVIVLSLLGAWTVSTMVFPRIHILVFVIGSLLSGVAIDYGFYIFLQPFRDAREGYPEKIRRLLKPLLASCLTTVIGFSLLLFSDLPLLREVGLFVGTGLLCALGAALLYFAQTGRAHLETRNFRLPPSGARFRLVLRLAAGGALVIAMVSPFRLHWRDDVRELQIATPALQENDAALRAEFGDSSDRSAFLTYGATIADARDQLEKFRRQEAIRFPDASAVSLGLVFPTKENWEKLPARLHALGDFPRDFRDALERGGFTAESFADFFAAWNLARQEPARGKYEDLYRAVAPALVGPLGMLYRADGDFCWFLTIVDRPDRWTPSPGVSTISLSQLESLNGLFTRYRWSALRLSLLGLALVIGSVFVIYRGRMAVRIALIPAGACFTVFGLFGLFGLTLNLFHLLGAFLGVCLSHNYAIFSAETSAARGAVPPASIRLSALCTAASFGVLALSRIPVIHALGLTVALIVLLSLTVVEMEPLARGAKKSA